MAAPKAAGCSSVVALLAFVLGRGAVYGEPDVLGDIGGVVADAFEVLGAFSVSSTSPVVFQVPMNVSNRVIRFLGMKTS